MIRAFATDYLDCNGVVMAESASKARYAFYLSAVDAGFKAKITDIRVWRMPKFDAGMTFSGKAETGRPYGSDYMKAEPCTS